MTRISALDVIDVRFPTSLGLDGSDAMNPEPDYSAAYVVLSLDDSDLARAVMQLSQHLLAHDHASTPVVTH